MTKRSYFSATFRCQHCAEAEPTDRRSGVYSALLDRWVSDLREPTVLRVGDLVDVSQQDFALAYVTVCVPVPETLTCLLESWNCPNCREDNWVEIVFDHYLISDIATVPPSQAVLDRTHYTTPGVYQEAFPQHDPDTPHRASRRV
jgi:hypothetical protein